MKCVVNEEVSCNIKFTSNVEPESPPVDFHASLVTAMTIRFQWKQPTKSNGVIIQYYILCNTNDKQMFIYIVNGSHTTTTVSGLLPYTNYFCSITANTSVGGGPGIAISITTKQDGEISVTPCIRLNLMVSYCASSQWIPSNVFHL